MLCIRCGKPITGFISIKKECRNCTIIRARENEIFWENLLPEDYDIQVFPEKDFVNPYVNVRFKNVV